MVQADRLGVKVYSHLALCCIHRVNQGELLQCFKYDSSAIKVILILLLLIKIQDDDVNTT